jgi:hypothetical protein
MGDEMQNGGMGDDEMQNGGMGDEMQNGRHTDSAVYFAHSPIRLFTSPIPPIRLFK